jgi:hypothetical protein
MDDKTRFITPLLVLLAGAISSIIMYVRHFELNAMLWTLLIVLIIFYFIGDTVRFIYSKIRPRIIPETDFSQMEQIARNRMNMMGNVVEVTNDDMVYNTTVENTTAESTDDDKEDLEEYESSEDDE